MNGHQGMFQAIPQFSAYLGYFGGGSMFQAMAGFGLPSYMPVNVFGTSPIDAESHVSECWYPTRLSKCQEALWGCLECHNTVAGKTQLERKI